MQLEDHGVGVMHLDFDTAAAELHLAGVARGEGERLVQGPGDAG